MKVHDSPGPRCRGCSEKLKQCHPYLDFWFHNRVKATWPDAHIAWGFRSKADQDLMVKEGLSNTEWPESKHNASDPTTKKPQSLALDLFQINDKGAGKWDSVWHAKVNAAMVENGDPMSWGGNFKVGPGKHRDFNHFEMDLTRYFIGPIPKSLS